AARGLRPAIDINGVGERTAITAAFLVGRTRHHGAVASGIRISPGNRGTRWRALERVDLRGISALLIFVVHCRTDAIADQAAKQAADHCACDSVARAASGD